MSEGGTVETLLRYTRPGQRPHFYTYDPGPGVPRAAIDPDPRQVVVEDARGQAAALSLDVQGLELHVAPTALTDFYDRDQVGNVYFPEVCALVQKATGANQVIAFDHNVRSGADARRSGRRVSAPVHYVHNDYTDRSGPRRVRDLLETGEAERRLRRRVAVINVWRPIVGPVESMPLGVCDATTLRPDDFLPTDLRYRDRDGEIYSVAYAARHRWLYVSRMAVDEVLLLKCYDSSRDGRARFTAHSAFADPKTPADAPPRESIEVRTLAFF